MSAAVVLGLGALGGCGAVARYLLDGAVTARLHRPFPFGTLVVNVSGAALLGVLTGAGVGGDGYRLWGVGLLGGYTTFSTWMFETDRLATEGRRRGAVSNVVLSVGLGLAAVWLGRRIG